MVEEDNSNSVTESQVVDAPVEAPEPKQKRAPRRSPAEMAAAAAAKSQKGSGRKNAKAKPVASATKSQLGAASKKTVSKSPASEPSQSATTHATAADEMANLVKLEEENRSLRGQLSEKLRAENADLRRRLGQAQ